MENRGKQNPKTGFKSPPSRDLQRLEFSRTDAAGWPDRPIVLCYARDYRLQLFNNLSFDQLDRLRIEMKMKELGESGPENPVKICVTDPLVVFSAC